MTPPAENAGSAKSAEVRHLAPLVDESLATRRLSKKFWRRPQAARLELVAWPQFLATFEIESPRSRAIGNQQPSRRVYIYVDGHEPSCIAMAQSPWPMGSTERAITIAPRILPDEASAAARRALSSGILSTTRWRTPPHYTATGPAEPLFWPLWAYYHRRRGGILDVLLLDAVRGNWCGPKVKGAFLAALVAAR